MEYPDLHRSITERLSEAKKKQAELPKRIAEAHEILKKHFEALNRKQKYFAQVKAFSDMGQSETAEEIWEKRKLGVTISRHENKTEEIKGMEGLEEDLSFLITHLRDDLEQLVNFNPRGDQEKHPLRDGFEKGGRDYFKTRNSRFRVFQDVFCRLKDRILPLNGSIYSYMNDDDLPLKPCVVDPALIRDSYLKHLGISIPDGLTSFQKLKFKADLIPQLKEFFQHSVFPLPKNDEDLRKKNYRLHWTKDGLLLNVRSFARSGKILQFFESAYAARRKTDYADRYYKTEIPMILRAQEDIQVLHKRALVLKKGDSDERESIIEGLIGLIDSFEGAINYNKQTVLNELKRLEKLKFKDRLGRQNLPAVFAKLIKIINRIKSRRFEIYGKSLASPEDEQSLNVLIVQSEKLIEQYGEAFEKLIQTGGSSLFSHLRPIRRLRVRPFNVYADEIQTSIHLSVEGVEQKDYKLINRAAIRGLAVTRLFNVEREREKILQELTAFSDLPALETLFAFCDRLLSVSHQNSVNGFETPFISIERALSQIKIDLQNINESSASQGEMYLLFKDQLKRIDFKTLLNQLDLSE